MKDRRDKNPEADRERCRRYYEQNPEKACERARLYQEQYPEKKRERERRLRQSPGHRLHQAITSGVRQSLKGSKNGRSWENLLGYTCEDLMTHLESQFQRGMTWGNYGRWHIDHIKPVSHFNFNFPEDPEFLECWSLWNLRPLWGRENISRGNRVDEVPLPLLTEGRRVA